MIRVLNLYGDPRSIGFQHGQQVADLRPQICSAIEHRLAELNQPGFDFSKIMAGMTGAFEVHAQSTLEMLQGMAEALDLEWEKYYTYTLASFLDSQIKNYRKAMAAQPGLRPGNTRATRRRFWQRTGITS
jgi:hypothetical protein